jgi:hypothetical protein
MTTLTVSALGFLALLLAFSLSHALSRYETRRSLIVDEANAIGSTAHLATMLPPQAQPEILRLLREYLAVRTNLGRPYDQAKLDRDATTSRELLTKLWEQAAPISDKQSLPAHRFITALDEMTTIQERRLISMRYYVPSAVLFILLWLAIVALGFTGYQSMGHAKGSTDAERREKQVPRPLPQLPVHRARKVVVVLGKWLAPAGLRAYARHRGSGLGSRFRSEQPSEPRRQTFHAVLRKAA